MRQLEERLGVRLLNRISLTDAGLRCSTGLGRRVEQDLKGEQWHPFGRRRLYVGHFAGVAVIAPDWGAFLSTFFDVQLDPRAAEALVDNVAKGFDAGISPKD
jgi:DNA-binding transcriptional LysR family regulator